MTSQSRVAVVGGARTPFQKANTAFSNLSALDLTGSLLEAYWAKAQCTADSVDEVVWSTVLHDSGISNIGREAILRSKLDKTVNAHTVSNNCISGLVAMTMVVDAIRSGRIGAGLAGGVESMSRPPLVFRREAQDIFLKIFGARSWQDRSRLMLRLRPNYFIPVPPSPKEPSTGKTMGEHCELMAQEWQISREDQDKWACESHHAAHKSSLDDLGDLVETHGVTADNIVRGNTSAERLAKLSTVFDRSSNGSLTAGNSSALTDGASLVHLMEEKIAEKQGRRPIAFIEDVEFGSVSPQDGLLMAPVVALPRLLARNNLTVGDIDYFEIHEAFAAQVLCSLKAWEHGWNKYPGCKIGGLPREKINVHGGSLAFGHPFAATGGRLVLNLARLLSQRTGSRGVISVCAAGGMGACVLMKG
jgi:acetyl-CoA C-acetyltransferase